MALVWVDQDERVAVGQREWGRGSVEVEGGGLLQRTEVEKAEAGVGPSEDTTESWSGEGHCATGRQDLNPPSTEGTHEHCNGSLRWTSREVPKQDIYFFKVDFFSHPNSSIIV